jgi:hypothetical protein
MMTAETNVLQEVLVPVPQLYKDKPGIKPRLQNPVSHFLNCLATLYENFHSLKCLLHHETEPRLVYDNNYIYS